MGGVPKEIPDFGSAAQRARQNPGFDPTSLSNFTSEDYYVWSRVDGTTTLKDLILMVGFEPERTIEILRRLRGFGALLLPDETPEMVAKRVAEQSASAAASPPPVNAKGTGQSLASGSAETAPDDSALTDEERAALQQADVVLTDAQKRRVLAMRRTIGRADFFELFDLGRDANNRQLKRAYFRLSKEFHPDRFYGKRLGPFEGWMAEVFEHLTNAFEVLSHPSKRDDYIARLSGQVRRPKGPQQQTKQEYAAELFDRARIAETSGDLSNAVQLFAAAVRVDPAAKYLRRAASCAVAAGELSDAEKYAKKAADLERQDPSYLRVLADVYRASARWGEAEQTLVQALELKTENDVLTGELQSDLEQVRRRRGS